jgi:hypothetical protein
VAIIGAGSCWLFLLVGWAVLLLSTIVCLQKHKKHTCRWDSVTSHCTVPLLVQTFLAVCRRLTPCCNLLLSMLGPGVCRYSYKFYIYGNYSVNYSVFFYSVLHGPSRGCNKCKAVDTVSLVPDASILQPRVFEK